jgi:hypothetical protein
MPHGHLRWWHRYQGERRALGMRLRGPAGRDAAVGAVGFADEPALGGHRGQEPAKAPARRRGNARLPAPAASAWTGSVCRPVCAVCYGRHAEVDRMLRFMARWACLGGFLPSRQIWRQVPLWTPVVPSFSRERLLSGRLRWHSRALPRSSLTGTGIS